MIVDECHHLSDWAPGGGDPTRKFKLVRELIAQQGPEARVVLLSGTPHQGNIARFENLLNLLKREREPVGALAGRVIYRTKEDVRDWENRPLFPDRRVASPVVIDLGSEYRDWIESIHEFFSPSNGTGGMSLCAAAGAPIGGVPKPSSGRRQAPKPDWATSRARRCGRAGTCATGLS